MDEWYEQLNLNCALILISSFLSIFFWLHFYRISIFFCIFFSLHVYTKISHSSSYRKKISKTKYWVFFSYSPFLEDDDDEEKIFTSCALCSWQIDQISILSAYIDISSSLLSASSLMISIRHAAYLLYFIEVFCSRITEIFVREVFEGLNDVID